MTVRSATFKKAERLTRPGEFRGVLSKGKSVKENGIAFYWQGRSLEGGISRLGILASRRASKKAVQRNRFKRAAREIFRHLKADFQTSFDVVVRALELNHKTASEMRELIKKLFIKSGIIK